jgi:hypothetical protein
MTSPSRSRRILSLFMVCGLFHLPGCGSGDAVSANPAIVVDDSITSGQCVVTVSYPAEAVVDLASVGFDYSDVVGNFGERGVHARCRSLVDGATRVTTVNTCDETCAQGERRRLYLDFAMGQALDDLVTHTPADLFECLFEGDGATLVELAGAPSLSGPFFEEIEEVPLEIRVECDGWPNATSTTSTTSTTLPCGGSGCEEGDRISLELWLDDEIELGSIQFDVTFSSRVGVFDQFTPGNVKCSLGAGVNALFATNQVPRIDDATCMDCERRFTAGFVFGNGYTGPGKLASCDFVVGPEVPAAADFSVEIVDVADIHVMPIDPPPGVSLRGFPED